MDKKTKVLAVMIILLSGVVINAHAAGTSSSSWGMEEQQDKTAVSLYDQGVGASENNDYLKALTLFEQALREDSSNPDILNMLAHTQLKLGMIDEALESYKRALALRPRFPEAREYLGEAYIQAALREMKTLQSYGGEGADNLKDLTKAFKDAVDSLEW